MCGSSGTRCQVHCVLAAGFGSAAPIPYWIVGIAGRLDEREGTFI